jgi:hypothetical protein
MQPLTRQFNFHACAVAATLGLLGGAALGALSLPSYHVSQKGRAFQPGLRTRVNGRHPGVDSLTIMGRAELPTTEMGSGNTRHASPFTPDHN